jgi:hypothetical protein
MQDFLFFFFFFISSIDEHPNKDLVLILSSVNVGHVPTNRILGDILVTKFPWIKNSI